MGEGGGGGGGGEREEGAHNETEEYMDSHREIHTHTQPTHTHNTRT